MPRRVDRESGVPAYKGVTLRQLKSFCETARSGSMTRAARDLRMSHPTVWKQVHALEARFGVKLIIPTSEGSELTDEGRALAELASPLVADIDRLGEEFGAVRARLRNRLTISASVRFLLEVLPDCVARFAKEHPDVLQSLRHVDDDLVGFSVESGESDLGLTGRHVSGTRSLLACRLCYQADVTLVVPAGHPLANKRRIGPADLMKYPLVNAPESFRDPAVNTRLARFDLFSHPERRVEAHAGMTVVRYVEMGFGIGLVAAVPGGPLSRRLAVRSMADHFGQIPVYLITRNPPKRPELVADFVRLLSRSVAPV